MMEDTTFASVYTRLKTHATRRGVLSGLVGATLAALAIPATADAGPGRKGGGGKGVGPDKPKTRGFTAEATGSVDQPAEENCQFSGQCTTTFVGTGTADHLGEVTFTSSLTADWSKFSGSPATGFCAPITAGEATFVAASNSKNPKGSLNFTISGTVCEDGPSATNPPLLLTGKYEIVGGTKNFAAATGTGTVGGSVTHDAASFTATGTIVC